VQADPVLQAGEGVAGPDQRRGPGRGRRPRPGRRRVIDPAGDAGRAAGRYYVETWGCQMNVLDADKMSGALERHGYGRAARAEEADVLLLNTCSIREKAHDKVFDELGRLKPLKDSRPGLVLAVCGCVAQQEGDRIFSRAPHVDLVIGTRATG